MAKSILRSRFCSIGSAGTTMAFLSLKQSRTMVIKEVSSPQPFYTISATAHFSYFKKSQSPTNKKNLRDKVTPVSLLILSLQEIQGEKLTDLVVIYNNLVILWGGWIVMKSRPSRWRDTSAAAPAASWFRASVEPVYLAHWWPIRRTADRQKCQDP